MTTPVEAAASPSQPKHLDLNLDYFKTHAGQLRIAQGALSLAAIVSTVEGHCRNDMPRYVFSLSVVVITMLEAILIIILFLLKQDKKLKVVNIPLTLLMNDSIILSFHFINSTLSMLAINRCLYRVEAGIIATLLAIALFLTYVGLIYTDYEWWEKDKISKETNTSTNGSTTVTESSPTVLT